MNRKRITQLFPFLLPLRKAQRKLCFYLRMHFDAHRYAKTRSARLLAHCAYKCETNLLNENTGFDIQYQQNKIFNLQLAAETMNGLLIHPHETFSFWQLVRHAEQNQRFKDGLSVVNGQLTTVRGGGLCHLSNFLFWMFLHSPLTLVERHPHRIKDFPSPDAKEPDSVDATVSEGWLDLKVKNDTELTFQIDLSFADAILHGRLLTDQAMSSRYEIANRDKQFFKREGRIFEHVSVCRQCIDYSTGQLLPEQLLYSDIFEIGYPLPEETEFVSKESHHE